MTNVSPTIYILRFLPCGLKVWVSTFAEQPSFNCLLYMCCACWSVNSIGGLCIVLVNWIIHYTTTCHIIIFFSVSIVCCIYINIIVILWPCPNLKDYLFKELIYFDLTKNVQQNINFLQYYGSTIYTWLKNLSSSSLYIHMTL